MQYNVISLKKKLKSSQFNEENLEELSFWLFRKKLHLINY